MRLIDADAIPWTDLNDNPNSKIRVLVTFADKVNKMPTIEQRKTGEWMDFSMSIKGVPTEVCGVCGEWSLGMGKNYCPNCGADMRGAQDG